MPPWLPSIFAVAPNTTAFIDANLEEHELLMVDPAWCPAPVLPTESTSHDVELAVSLLDMVLKPFTTPAVTFAGATTSWGEVAGFVTGALCVWLVTRQNVWNWPIGILNNLAFLALFATSGLYADSGLQAVYLGLALYGWWAWLHGGNDRSALPVSHTTNAQWTWLVITGVGITLALVWVLTALTNSTVPWADAITTALSLLATWGQTRKKVECWWLWIAADLVYVPLYAYKGLWLTAVLYVGFLGLCVLGLRSWTTTVRDREALSARPRHAGPVG